MPFLTIAILAVVVFYFISNYNGFVTLKTRIKASIQEIGNQLKRQAELIPNLQESVKGYLKQEKDIFKMLTDARKQVDSALASGKLDDMASAGSKVAELLPKLQVVVESNPQLKSAEVVTRLMDELRDTSDKVMYSRRTLIDLTADYNVKIATFPSNLVAKMFNFQAEAGLKTDASGDFLTVSASDTKTPKVNL